VKQYEANGRPGENILTQTKKGKKSDHQWKEGYPADGDRLAVMYDGEFWGLTVIQSKSRKGKFGWMGEVLWDDGKKGLVRWEKAKWLPSQKTWIYQGSCFKWLGG